MKKIFLMLLAVSAMALVSCTGNSENAASGSKASAASEKADAPKGNTYEGDNFTMTLPEILKESAKSGSFVNARSEGNDVSMDATFSEMPCKPSDFQQYVKNFTGMSLYKDYKFEDPKIDGNFLTFKGVNGEKAATNFVVYLDEKAGVAGKVEYPVAKAGEIEPLITPMLKSIKKK